MTVTIDCHFDVSIADLHTAIRAVLPHAEKPRLGDEVHALARVRLTATANELLLAATNGRTAALAAVGILDGSDSRAERFSADDGEFIVDVHPAKLRDLRDGVTAQKDEGELVGEAELTFTGPSADGQSPGTVAARDVGGLWIGSLTERPLLPLASDYPDIRGALRDALRLAEGTYKPLVADGVDLDAFRAAARAYGRPLSVEPVGTAEQRGWLVLCGPSFAGSIQGQHDADSLAKRDRYRQVHLERFGLVTALEKAVDEVFA